MTREIITFTPEHFLESARLEFERINGFKAGNNKHRRMSDMADKVLDSIIDRIRPVAVVSAFGGHALHNDTISAGGFDFTCNAFVLFEPESVRRIYAFMLTLGDFTIEFDGIMSAVFADMWGTVFCDAAVHALADKLKTTAVIYPGFYGFSLSNIPKFSQLLDGESIGITVREPGFTMMPVKSCCGLMFESIGTAVLPESECKDCTANKYWCIMCKKSPKK